MPKFLSVKCLSLCFVVAALASACVQPQSNMSAIPNSNVAAFNANASNSNSMAATGGSTIDTREPDQYQATVKLSFQASGDQQNMTLPPLTANVARSGGDREMEFILPNNEKVIYLDKAGKNYLILPNRRQYAELDKETLGFEVRSLMMPENIVGQLQKMQGVEPAGEETVNGRQAIKYTYRATADTQTQAGKVDTTSYFLVDKETGLPLRSETVSQTQSGANVQGYKGLSLITEMSDVKTTPDPKLFELPTDYAKIDPEQVKAQVNVIFQAAAAIVGQLVKQAQQPAGTPAVSPSPTM